MKENKQEAKLNVRFPLEVMTMLRERACKHQRSLDGEIVWIIREYLERQSTSHEEEYVAHVPAGNPLAGE